MLSAKTWLRRSTIGAAALAIMATGSTVSAEPVSIDAFSVWTATGKIFKTGVQKGTFVGVLRGPLYIETERGPVGAGDIACPFVIRINLETGEQEGAGDCTFTAKDGPLAFSTIKCRGFHLIGCKGDFALTGGTERFEGVRGGGPVTFRSDKWEIASDTGSEVTEVATGIAFWRDLTYEVSSSE